MSRFAFTYEDPSYEYDESNDDTELDYVPTLKVTDKVNVTDDEETYYGA